MVEGFFGGPEADRLFKVDAVDLCVCNIPNHIYLKAQR